jgi:hypothetical protein
MTPKELEAAYRMEERLKKGEAKQPDNKSDIDYLNASITLRQALDMRQIAQNAVFRLVRE